MSTRVSSSRLIGRAAELAELEAALADAAGGRPSIAIVAGESGVGKSRLLAELEARARESGALVLTGDCVDLGESELPYVPLVAALRPLARSGDPALTDAVRAAVGAADARASARPPTPATPATTAARRRGCSRACCRCSTRSASQQPVLLLIEDLHWADRSTRAALAFLARSLIAERVLVVGSYRPDELHRRHPLRPLLAELERDARTRTASRSTRSRTTSSPTSSTDILGEPPDAELLERLWTRSGGNPLFSRGAAGGRRRRPRRRAGHAARRADAAGRAAVRSPRRRSCGSSRSASGWTTRCSPRRAGSTSARCATRCARRSTATSSSPTTTARTASATRCCARWSTTTCCRASARRCTCALGEGDRAAHRRALRRGADRRGRPPLRRRRRAARRRSSGRCAPRPPPSASTPTARRSALLERALELWDRVPDAEERAGADRVTLLVRAPDAAAWALGHPGRQLALFEAALAELGPRPDPCRAARAARRASPAPSAASTARSRASRRSSGRSSWSRPPTATTRRGARPRCSPGWPARRMLDGRFSDGVEVARKALEATIAAGLRGDRGSRAQHARLLPGDDRRGRRGRRGAARGDPASRASATTCTTSADAYVNYSDMLHLARALRRGARRSPLEGREASRRPAADRDDVARLPALRVRLRRRRLGRGRARCCPTRCAGPARTRA